MNLLFVAFVPESGGVSGECNSLSVLRQSVDTRPRKVPPVCSASCGVKEAYRIVRASLGLPCAGVGKIGVPGNFRRQGSDSLRREDVIATGDCEDAIGVSATLTAAPMLQESDCCGGCFDGVSSTTILVWCEEDCPSDWIARRRLLRVGVASPSGRLGALE